ncbi:hypothetical protein C0J52_20282 [Blattella germanica]|nr:hypothetical protein C0J52_20282 [Blattella germanica]
MLNNLLIRFETGYITDFYEYFKQPWCYAILHDRFKDFVKNLDKVFIQKEGTSFSPLTESIRLYLLRTNWKKMPLNKLDEFKTIYRTDHEQKIQDILIKFLSDNSYHLTMYAYPEVVKRILHGYENSLMFQKPDDTSSDDSDFELSEQ